MGKYMKKSKISGEVSVMEVISNSLGVRTRARTRTLALQRRLQNSNNNPNPSSPESSSSASSSCYLQLRSRRLPKVIPNPNPNPSSAAPKTEVVVGEESDAGIEVSFGENVLEIENRSAGRNTRETTPCSLIRDSETIGTPGSTTRPTSTAATNRRIQSSTRRNIPTSQEMEEFFAGAEHLQQKVFVDKYNFDPVNDCPIPGRYEWVKLEN